MEKKIKILKQILIIIVTLTMSSIHTNRYMNDNKHKKKANTK